MRRMILGLWYAGGKHWADDGYGNLTAADITLASNFLQWNCEGNCYA